MNLQLDNSNVDASSNSRQQDRPSVKKDVSKMIWVIVGKTEHQAWLAEDTIEGKEKVFIEWQSTGRREQVPASSIRFGIPRQRRRTSRAEINVKSFDGAAYGTGDGEDDEKNKKVKKNAPRKKKKDTATQMASSEKKRKRNASDSASGAVESTSLATGSSRSGDESVTANRTDNGVKHKKSTASGNKVGASMSRKKLGSSGTNDKENRKRKRTATGETQVMTLATTADRPDINVSDKSFRQIAYETTSEPTRKDGTGNEAQSANDATKKKTSEKLPGGNSGIITSKGQVRLSHENGGNTRNSEQSTIDNPTAQISAAHLEGTQSITNNLMDNANDNRASQALNGQSGTFMKVDSARLQDKLGNRLTPSEGEYLEPSHSLAKISMEGRESAREDMTNLSRTSASDIAKSTSPSTGEIYGEKVSLFHGAVASTLYGSNCMKMPDRQDDQCGILATGIINSGIASATRIIDHSMGNKDIRAPIAHVEMAKSSTFPVEQVRATDKQAKSLSASSMQGVSSARDSTLNMHTDNSKSSASSKSEKSDFTSNVGQRGENDATKKFVAGANTATNLSSDTYGNSKNDSRDGKKSGGDSLDIESGYKSTTADGRNPKTLLGWSGGESLKTKTTFASTFLTAKFLNESTSKDPVVDGKPEVTSGSFPQSSGTESSRKSDTRQGQALSSDNSDLSKSAMIRKRPASAGLQDGERCLLKPIWPAFFAVSPGQYDVKFSKDGMNLFQECLYEDITNLLEDVRVMKQEEVDAILDAK